MKSVTNPDRKGDHYPQKFAKQFGFMNTYHSDVIMGAMASEIITGGSTACSTVCSGADQRKRQSSASLAFVKGIHRWPVNNPHKGPITRKMFPFDDVKMRTDDIALRFDQVGNVPSGIYFIRACEAPMNLPYVSCGAFMAYQSIAG